MRRACPADGRSVSRAGSGRVPGGGQVCLRGVVEGGQAAPGGVCRQPALGRLVAVEGPAEELGRGVRDDPQRRAVAEQGPPVVAPGQAEHRLGPGHPVVRGPPGRVVDHLVEFAVYEELRSGCPGERTAHAEGGAGEDHPGVQPVVPAGGEQADGGHPAGRVPGGGHPVDGQPPTQRIARPPVQREHLGQHVRDVGGLVEHVEGIDLTGAPAGVREGRRGHHETGRRPAGQQRGVVARPGVQPVTEHHQREPAVRHRRRPGRRAAGRTPGRVPEGHRQGAVAVPVEVELAYADRERPPRCPPRGDGRTDGAGRAGGRRRLGGRGPGGRGGVRRAPGQTDREQCGGDDSGAGTT